MQSRTDFVIVAKINDKAKMKLVYRTDREKSQPQQGKILFTSAAEKTSRGYLINRD